MRIKRFLAGNLFAALFLISAVTPAGAANLIISKDRKIALPLEPGWTQETSGPGLFVIGASSGNASISISYSLLTTPQLKISRMEKEYKEIMKKRYTLMSSVTTEKLPSGGVFVYIDYQKAKDTFRQGHFEFNNRHYYLAAQNIPKAKLAAIMNSLAVPKYVENSDEKTLHGGHWVTDPSGLVRYPIRDDDNVSIISSTATPGSFILSKAGKGRLSIELGDYNAIASPKDFINEKADKVKAAISAECAFFGPAPATLDNGWEAYIATSPCAGKGDVPYLMLAVKTSSYILYGEGVNFQPEDALSIMGNARLSPYILELSTPTPNSFRPGRENPPPLPHEKTAHSTGINWIIGFVIFISATLIIRTAITARMKVVAHGLPNTPYPVTVTRDRAFFTQRYTVKDAFGGSWTASRAKPGISLIVWGLIINTASFVATESAVMTAQSNPVIPYLAYLPYLGIAMFFAGLAKLAFSIPPTYIYDKNGLAIGVFMKTRHNQYSLMTDNGTELVRLHKKPFGILLRRWIILPPIGTNAAPFMQIAEKSAKKAIARKMFGHFWGALRSSYTLEDAAGHPVGEILRGTAIRNTYYVTITDSKFVTEPPNLQGFIMDHTILVPCAVFIEIHDTDRWYPWFN